MRALIFSDSHGSISSMTNVIDREKNIDYIIHAGDVYKDVCELIKFYPDKNFIYVIGNNDYFVKNQPSERLFELGGVKIFLTHGHNYSVKYGLYNIYAAAREKGASLCIFGHTHSRLNEEQDGIRLFNPGSSVRSSGLLEIQDGKITKLDFLY